MAHQTDTDETEKTGNGTISIRAKGVDIPDDEEARGALLDDLGELLGDALRENHGVHSEVVTSNVGHEYAQIQTECPKCGGNLNIGEIWGGAGNAAYGDASCPDCQYVGAATYRVIDLESDGEHESAVCEGKATPTYVGYGIE